MTCAPTVEVEAEAKEAVEDCDKPGTAVDCNPAFAPPLIVKPESMPSSAELGGGGRS
jgi:hypothetical protein